MREAFLQLLNGERPRETVWCVDLTYYVDAHVAAGDAPARWQDEIGHLELCRELGCLPYFWYDRFWAGTPAFEGVEVDAETAGATRRQTWRSPAGTLTGITERLGGSWSDAPVQYPVQTEADLDVWLDILTRRRLEPANLDEYRARLELWARYDGVPCLGLPRSPLPAFITEWAGVAHGALLLADCPDKVAAGLALLEKQEQAILDAVAHLLPPVVHFPDNLSSDNLTPFFDSHLAGPYRRRLARLHAAGVRCAVHLDGAVRGLLPKLAGVGFDAVEAVTPQPVGDVSLQEMRALAGRDDLVLWGGVPGAMFAPPFDWPRMERHVAALLDAWRGTPFIVGSADQLPPNGDLSWVRRIADRLN